MSEDTLAEKIAKIIDPHSFIDIPFTDEQVLLDMVEDSKKDALRKATRIIAIAEFAAHPSPTGEKVEAVAHPDDLAVDRFAAAMKAKLARKRAEGRGGWEDREQCSSWFLSRLLREHVDKGDPLDVGNLAMMLHQRGERIAL